MSSNKFTVPSFAKINLSLRVLGRRTDGYHEVRTVLQTITLHDTLTFERRAASAPLEIFCDDESIPTDERNLVHKAADALRRRYGADGGARVRIEKRIPSGGGLGGGSSNAAVALLAFARLWNLPVSAAELSPVAAELGADVPFFLSGGTAVGTGTGAVITPLADAPPRHLLVVTPPVRVPTAAAYAALNKSRTAFLTNDKPASILTDSHAGSLFEILAADEWRNDFEPVVFRDYPQTETARQQLLHYGARQAMLSGSGASVFGIFDTQEQSQKAHDALRHQAAWRVFSCATLDRRSYRAALRDVFERVG